MTYNVGDLIKLSPHMYHASMRVGNLREVSGKLVNIMPDDLMIVLGGFTLAEEYQYLFVMSADHNEIGFVSARAVERA
jgi:hypothetical protein